MFREEIRLAAWNLINGQLRPTYLRESGTRLRARVSLGETDLAISEWIKLATWLEERGICRLANATPASCTTTANSAETRASDGSASTRPWAR